jgi:ribosomal protein L7/L12
MLIWQMDVALVEGFSRVKVRVIKEYRRYVSLLLKQAKR